MKTKLTNFFSILLMLIGYLSTLTVHGQEKPNIILIFPDNLGIGEVSAYGSARGIKTPNIDKIGEEGIRLNNFNVEYSCVVSRIAILTGRYAVRTGEGAAGHGMTLWEKTIPEGLKTAGYATALYGKWHVGGPNWHGNREPTHQGFDEWWGIPGTSHTAQFTSFDGFDPSKFETPYIWEGVSGQAAKKVKPYNLEARRTIDREAAIKGVDFINRSAKKQQPFFLFYPMTQIHFPTLPHPDKQGVTGSGDIADAMADVDHNVGLLLDELKRLGIEENTLVIWCTDNGAEMRRPWRGSAGPWRGYYNSAMEGGIRTPFVARWPNKIKPGQVSNQLVHEVDLFPTLMTIAGIPEFVPKDRIIDGVDQLPFLAGNQEKSNRESALFLAREGHVMAVKWHNWKMWYYFKTELNPEPDNLIRLFDLNVDPREEVDVKDFYPWVIPIMDGIVAEYEASLVAHPRVPRYAEDPYIPPKAGTGEPVETYARSDRAVLSERSEAMPKPNFSGSWSTTILKSSPPRRGPAIEPSPTLGSGWGDEISIIHTDDQIEIERILFVPREIQPPIRYRYALDGSKTQNGITTGRTLPPPVSKTEWKDNRLVITTNYSYPEDGKWLKAKLVQTVWLQYADDTPWEPSLVVETARYGAMGGIPVTNRTIYSRGYN
ncbi:sulfatase-like hydrolase/transferase [Flagellimonas meishanensis]|uniref:sulfatase-like hydrolase/transferase n=1 Tax=Flagellimonas meishanensis TaxID=2873264 RepID=UPI001CA64255|nr:sulfatase-like hydrolase/transferase [[Muricauda] meishanensis]